MKMQKLPETSFVVIFNQELLSDVKVLIQLRVITYVEFG